MTMIDKIWKLAKEIAIAVVVAVGLWRLIGGATNKDSLGSLSDWISAMCNIVIASAAIYAAFQAKNWFRSKSQQFAFDKSAEFFSRLDDVVYEYDTLFQEFRYFNQFADDPIEAFQQSVVKIKILENELNEIQKIKNKLNRFNVSFTIPIDEALKSIKAFSKKFGDHLYHSINHHRSYDPTAEEQSPEYIENFLGNIESLNSLFDEMNKSSNLVRESSKNISQAIKIGS